ncbi:MAG TPA: cytochrome c peroxidase [Vicinamibacterales bacterium]|nr:cytochrome c peroxidase [Vicinamibacterales bacterium]
MGQGGRRRGSRRVGWLIAGAVAAASCVLAPTLAIGSAADQSLDASLRERLNAEGFTGRIEATLTERLGRPLDPRLADTGRMLWFDTITGLNDDNACAGCHSPTTGFGDTQSIAIGVGSNGIVGPDRAGPRNQRRAPMVLNTAFFPSLMLNNRFSSLSGNPFDPSAGFLFPAPESTSLSYLPHLLDAQAFIPPTERAEAAGFSFSGDNDAIRAEVVRRLNGTPGYRNLFARVFPEVRRGAPITYEMVARAIAEFEFSLTFANAPIDRYARGERSALNEQEKRGALLFFGEAGCVSCHQVSGKSNEMFSDFKDHVAGVPQIVPNDANVPFDGPDGNEDFGREQFTGDAADRYAFRTSPLRNIALQPTFMHDGAFTTLEAAVRHHLNVVASALTYDPVVQGLDTDLTGPTAPLTPILLRLDPLLVSPQRLSEEQLDSIVAFLRNGLLDPRASPERLRHLIPEKLPSNRPSLVFQFGQR